MATVTVTPAAVSLPSVGAAVDITVQVGGVAGGTPAFTGNVTFTIDVGGQAMSGVATITGQGGTATVPVHATPVGDATLQGKISVNRTSLTPDGLTAVYRITRVA